MGNHLAHCPQPSALRGRDMGRRFCLLEHPVLEQAYNVRRAERVAHRAKAKTSARWVGGRGTFPQVPGQVPEGQEWEQNPRCALCPSPPPPPWPLTAAASRQQRLHLPFLLGSSASDDGACPGARGMALDSNPMTLASKTYSSSVSIFREAEKRLSHHTSQDNLEIREIICEKELGPLGRKVS